MTIKLIKPAKKFSGADEACPKCEAVVRVEQLSDYTVTKAIHDSLAIGWRCPECASHNASTVNFSASDRTQLRAIWENRNTNTYFSER